MVFNNHLYLKYFHGTVKCEDMNIYNILTQLRKKQERRENYWLNRRNKIQGEWQDLQLDYIDKLILKDMDLLMNKQTDTIRELLIQRKAHSK